jgi:hypothetical protein
MDISRIGTLKKEICPEISPHLKKKSPNSLWRGLKKIGGGFGGSPSY